MLASALRAWGLTPTRPPPELIARSTSRASTGAPMLAVSTSMMALAVKSMIRVPLTGSQVMSRYRAISLTRPCRHCPFEFVRVHSLAHLGQHPHQLGFTRQPIGALTHHLRIEGVEAMQRGGRAVHVADLPVSVHP